MKSKNSTIVRNVLLIIFICLNLANINAGRFDGEPPLETVEVTETPDENEPPVESTPPAPVVTEETTTEEPVATEVVPTEEPIATEEPPLEEPVATEVTTTEESAATEETPTEEAVADEEVIPEEQTVTELLSDMPENTEVVVLDENGEAVPLVEQEAADIILEEDPMWCPHDTLPGGSGCTTNYSSISALINELTGSRRYRYEQDGIIYFTSGDTNASFSLTRSSLGTSDFNALDNYNLTLQGGWNGANGGSATFNGITYFESNTLTIGDSSYRWDGNISLINFNFNNVSSNNAITVYTSSGDISLDNVTVTSQRGDDYTAYLDSNSGDITVEDSHFDGYLSGSNSNRGFSAETDSGSIEITDTTFRDAYNSSNTTNYNGATLSAPTVTLTNVTAYRNDLNGIQISNADSVTLNNVTATNNGTSYTSGWWWNPTTYYYGSGVEVNGTGSTIVNVNGGTLSDNERYGLSVFDGSISAQLDPTCSGNTYPGPHPSRCYNINPIIANTPPTLNLPGNITAEATSPSGAVVNFSVTATDIQDGELTPTCSETSGDTFPIGATTVDCSVTDSDDNTTEGSFTISVIDTPPVLGLPGNITAEATSPSGVAVNFNVTATDNQDGSLTPTCSHTSGSTFPIGATTVDCSVTDSGGNTATGSFTITIIDLPPVLNLPGNITAEATSPSGAAVNFTATATDLVDGTVPVICSPSSGSSFPITSWWSSGVQVNCSATDSGGNTVSGSFRVRVQDTTPPALNLPGNITREATGPSGAIVNFSVSAADLVDSSPWLVCWGGDSGDTFPIGTTTISCLTGDENWNVASGSFTITVVDTTPPALTLPGDITQEATGPSGNIVTFSASATDIVDGARTVTCSPVSGSTFGLGTTTVTCSASDTRGNVGTGSFNVIVQDTTPPVLTLPSDITEEATGPSGNIITFSVSATDIADLTPTVSCTPASGSTFGLTTTTVNCSATDDSGNVANGSFTVTVQDTTPPTLTLPSDIIEEATSPSGNVITFSVSATDIADLTPIVSCTPASGSTFGLTTTTVNCSATDDSGNVTYGSFTVTVQDTTPPTLTLPSDIIKEATGPTGAVVNFSASATDIVDGSVAVTCSAISGSTFPISITTVDCSATDGAGNTVSGSFKITVQDQTPPVIAPHEDLKFETWKAQSQVRYSPPTTSDIVDGAGVATCTPAPGSMFPIGITVVTCTATDSYGNVSIPVTFTITIEQISRPVTDGTSSIIPVTGGSLFAVSCIDPSVNILLPPGAKITFINLCGYQAVAKEVLADKLPGALPSGASFVNGVAINVFQDGKQVKPLPGEASLLLGMPTPANTEGKYAILFWDGSKWAELNGQNNEDGYVDVASKQTGIFILVSK